MKRIIKNSKNSYGDTNIIPNPIEIMSENARQPSRTAKDFSMKTTLLSEVEPIELNLGLSVKPARPIGIMTFEGFRIQPLKKRKQSILQKDNFEKIYQSPPESTLSGGNEFESYDVRDHFN